MQNAATTGLRRIDVKLSNPVEWHGQMISSVTVQEPDAYTMFKLGDPQTPYWDNVGGGMMVDVGPTLMAYVRECVKVDGGDLFLKLIPASDGRAIKKVLLSFFRDTTEAPSS